MNYEKLIELTADRGWFDFATLVQITDEQRHSLQVQLHRWLKSGKLLSLRRGMYALPERFRKRPLDPMELANRIYAPSYLSTHWVLGYYGMIPEQVHRYTSVTRRKPARFENEFGTFDYRNLKAEAFFGYQTISSKRGSALVAEPEKALLDLWHLESGNWHRARMEAMRFQGFDNVDAKRLEDYASRFASPRIEAAVETWLALREEQQEGLEL